MKKQEKRVLSRLSEGPAMTCGKLLYGKSTLCGLESLRTKSQKGFSQGKSQGEYE